jgi:hypothetical protein
VRLYRGADKFIARPTSRCRRTESIVSLEIHAILTETLREYAPSYATVKNWVAQFKRDDFSTFSFFLVGLRTYQPPGYSALIQAHRIHKNENFNSSLIYLDILSIVDFFKHVCVCVCRNMFEILRSCKMYRLKINYE